MGVLSFAICEGCWQCLFDCYLIDYMTIRYGFEHFATQGAVCDEGKVLFRMKAIPMRSHLHWRIGVKGGNFFLEADGVGHLMVIKNMRDERALTEILLP